jgi:hypothetical protein
MLDNGALVYPSQGVLKVAWHWGRDCSVENDPTAETDCTPLYVSLPSTWISVDGNQISSPFFVGAPYWGL